MKDSFLSRTFMVSIIFIIGIVALIYAKQIVIPLTLSIFLALGLSPLVEWFRRKKIPKIISVILAFILGLIAVGAIGYIVGFAISDFAGKAPTYFTDINQNVSSTKLLLMEKFSLTDADVANYSENFNLSSIGATIAKTVVSATTTLLGMIGLTFVMTFLLLLYRDRVKKFTTMIANTHHQEAIHTIVHKSFHILPRYIGGMLLVITIMTGLNTLGFWIIGIPSPLFWGIIVSLLNVIPYVGTVIGFGAVTLFALLVAGPATALFAVIMFIVVQFLDNNFLTPTIAGGQIDINPLAAIISIVVWGMIWGIVGMVLALPILGLIKIICDTIPELKPYGYLLGNRE
jgi:predicted PurR-regulated permease PerM